MTRCGCNGQSHRQHMHLVTVVSMGWGAVGEDSVMEQVVKKFKQRGGQSNVKWRPQELEEKDR